MYSTKIINKIIGLSGMALIFMFYLAFTGMVITANTYADVDNQPVAQEGGSYKCPDTSVIDCDSNDPVMGLLNQAITILTSGIAIVAVGAIIYGAFLYTTSAGNSDQTKKALEIFRNVAIGLVAYGAMYILLNWIIPGGVF